MRENGRVRRRGAGWAPGARRAAALLALTAAMLGAAFVLGVSVGRQAAPVPATPVATRAALDHLDDLPSVHDEAAPVLKAPQVLTDTRPVEKAMPLAPAKLVPVPAATSTATSTASWTSSATPARGPSSPSPREGASTPERRGAYAIQVASSATRADAERVATRLAAQAPRIVAAEVPGKGRWYRVQVGAFPTQEAARKQLAQLARAGVHGLVVTAPR